MRTPLAYLATFAAILTTAACGDSSEQSDKPVGAETSVEEIQASAQRDACEVLTVADVQPYFAEPLTAKPGTRGVNTTKCEYWADDFRAGFSIEWTGGKETYEMQQGAVEMASKLMAEPGGNVDSIVTPGPVAGLGDAATFSELIPSIVLVGDRLLEFQIMLVPDARAAFVPLAKKALARL